MRSNRIKRFNHSLSPSALFRIPSKRASRIISVIHPIVGIHEWIKIINTVYLRTSRPFRRWDFKKYGSIQRIEAPYHTTSNSKERFEIVAQQRSYTTYYHCKPSCKEPVVPLAFNIKVKLCLCHFMDFLQFFLFDRSRLNKARNLIKENGKNNIIDNEIQYRLPPYYKTWESKKCCEKCNRKAVHKNIRTRTNFHQLTPYFSIISNKKGK